MFTETIREALAFIGLLALMVALLGIGLNELLYGTWYGETEEQRRERMRKERRRDPSTDPSLPSPASRGGKAGDAKELRGEN